MPAFLWVGPDQAPFFESASTDDKLWFVPVSLDQVRSFIQDPARWIAELNAKIPSGIKDKVVLTNDFALRLKLRASTGQLAADGKECLLQGIVNTNVVTVRPRVALVPAVPATWDNYWDDWSRGGAKLKVTISGDSNQGYGHLELTQDTDTPDVRADKIAAFLMWGADPKKTYQLGPTSPAIPYLNKVLLKTPDSLTIVTNGVISNPTPVQNVFQQVIDKDFDRITFTLVSRQSDFSQQSPPVTDGPLAEGEDDPEPPAVACDNMNGTLIAQFIVVDDVLVKNYVLNPEP